MARIHDIILNRSDGSEHLCLIPDSSRESIQTFNMKHGVNCGFIAYILYQMK